MDPRHPLLKRTILIWLLLELISAAQVRNNHEILLVSWLRALSTPIASSVTWVLDTGRDLVRGLQDTQRLVAEVRETSRELAQARATTYLLAEENRALREAQRVSLALPSIIDDRIISRCSYRNLSLGRVEISAGAREGVGVDDAVISANGVVGRVVKVAAHSCHVEALTHPAAAVAVTNLSGEVHGLATGCGPECLHIELVPRSASLLRGAMFVTSGADGIYPPGVPVARVTRIRETGKPFLEIAATPTAQLQELSVVAVLHWPRGGLGAEQ